MYIVRVNFQMCPTVKGGFFPSEFKNLTTITFLKKHLKKAEIFPLVYPAMRIILFVQVLEYPCLRLVSRQIKPKPSAWLDTSTGKS